MPSLWEVLKTSKGLPAPDGFTALFAHSLSDTYTLSEISGIPPLNLGEIVEIVDYTIYGNIYQSDGVSPDTPQEVKGVGERTVNLINTNTIVKGCLDDGVLGYEEETTELIVSGNIIKCTTTKPWRGFVTDFIPVEQGRYYLYHIMTPNNITYAYRMSVYDSQKNFIRVTAQSERTITIDEGEAFIRVSYQLGVAGTFEISNIMLSEGSTSLPYEPYGYKIPLVMRGKNLFDKETMLADIPVTTIVAYKSLYVGSGTFALSADLIFLDSATQASDIFLLAGKVTTGASTQDNGVYKGKSVTVTAVDGYITIGIRNRYTNILDSNIMLNAGTTPELYEPYTPPITTPIYLESPLYKIGDYADSRGKTEEVRVIKELVLTGEESWQIYTDGKKVHQFYTDLPTDKTSTSGLSAYSNIVGYGATANNRNEYEFGCYPVTSGTQIAFQMQGAKEQFADISAWKSYLAAQYSAGTPVKVYYVLAEPTVKTVDAVEIPTLNGTTVINVDTEVKPSNLKITYKSKM